jgi:hypothetical protein
MVELRNESQYQGNRAFIQLCVNYNKSDSQFLIRICARIVT